MSMPDSRISLRVDADVAGGKVAGYFEADFLGAVAQNANVTSNSNTFRSRLYFVGLPARTVGTPGRTGMDPAHSEPGRNIAMAQ